ncbi:MAG TPA: hypothetical protein VGP87_16485 [Gemmatimonadales bacterium]|jgi:hypothetical protein|nr:hypothetical protein [Gemmatimonadales bacterium]
MRALALSLVAFPLLLAAPVLAQKSTMTGFCFTDVSGATVYFSSLYDSGLNADVTLNYDGRASSREFLAYVKARYNYTSGSNYPSTCSYRASHDAAEVIRGGLMGRVQQENRKAVEVDWSATIDSAEVAASFGAPGPQHGPQGGRPAPKSEHAYCVSLANPGPQYVSAVFVPPQPVAVYQWVQGFGKYLTAKYQYKGEIYCNIENIEIAKRIIRAYSDGAKAAGRKVVDTAWKFGPGT